MSGKIRHTILVVDDIVINIDILVETLGDTYNMAVAIDGEAALKAVKDNPPDLILLDIMMPGMDGYEVCRRLKADHETRNIPVIFATAKSEIEDEKRGLELGAVDYITKPISPPIVKARVKNHLALKDARDHLEELVAERTRQLNIRVRELEGRDQLVHFQMQSPDVEKASQEILRVLAEVLSVEKASIYFPSESGTELDSVISADIPLSEISQEGTSNPDETLSLALKAFQQKKVVLGSDRQMAAPVVYNEDVLGVIWVSMLSSQETTDDAPNILWRMATVAATVLRMARFTEYLQGDDVEFDGLLAFAEQNL